MEIWQKRLAFKLKKLPHKSFLNSEAIWKTQLEIVVCVLKKSRSYYGTTQVNEAFYL